MDAVQSPCLAPRHLASPICGVAGEPAMPAGSQLTHPRPYNSPRATTWASVARGEGASVVNTARPQQQPAVTAAEFIALYDRCLASGLKARVAFSHAAGRQTLSLTCIFPVPAGSAAAAGKRSRRCWKAQPPLPESAAAAIDAVGGAVEPPPLRRMLRFGSHFLPPTQQLSKRRSLHCPCRLQETPLHL
jgi:hypothetical protein